MFSTILLSWSRKVKAITVSVSLRISGTRVVFAFITYFFIICTYSSVWERGFLYYLLAMIRDDGQYR